MALEYHGSFKGHNQEVMSDPQAQELVDEASQSVDEMRADVKDELSSKVTKSYISSETNKLASVTETTEEFSTVLDDRELGASVAQLEQTGLLHPDMFPNVSTRGAQFFSWSGTLPSPVSTPSNPNHNLANLQVSGPPDTSYVVFAWAQVETSVEGQQTAGIEIVAGATGLPRISYGYGTADWNTDWDVITASPTGFTHSYFAPVTLQLKTVRSGPASSQGTIHYSNYNPLFVAMTIPITP